MTRKVLKKVGVQEEVQQKPAPQNKTQVSDLASHSRIKLSFDGDPQFFVNTENKSIACKIRSYINLPLELRLLSNYIFCERNGNERFCTFTTVGVVKLHEGEEWNEELGRRLAEGKAKKQAYVKGYNYINNVLKDIVRDLYSVVAFRDNMKALCEHEIEHFNKLVNDSDV